MQETGTLGVRFTEEKRKCLNREIYEKEIMLHDQKFKIHIKKSTDSLGSILQEKIEFEDIKKIANSLQIPIRVAEKYIKNLLNLPFE